MRMISTIWMRMISATMNNRKPRRVRIPDSPEEAYRNALKTAMNIVGYKDNSEATLRQKLAERGYAEETVDGVLGYMVAKGYVNEERMLYRTVRLLAEGKLYGKERIRQELQRKAFRSDVLAQLDWSDESLADLDFAVLCYRLLKKRGGQRDERTYAALRRYGHASSDIKKAYAMLAEDDSE